MEIENKQKKTTTNKPFYKKQWFVISAIIFFLCVLQIFYSLNSETALVQTQTYTPPTKQTLPLATSTSTTPFADAVRAVLESTQKNASSTSLPPIFQNSIPKTDSPIQIIPQEKSTADIVAEWQNRVARVSCELISNGVDVISQGSATLSNSRDSDGSIIMVAITNRHVIPGDYNDPGACAIGIYSAGARGVMDPTAFKFGTTEDYAYINLDKASSVTETTWKSNLSSNMKICSNSQVNLGDNLVILGYPAIGTQGGITITKGIVSGIEKNYFLTDAKIDHGNSGGTAVLVKDDCYLGIPSASVTGTIESMGRILKASFVIN